MTSSSLQPPPQAAGADAVSLSFIRSSPSLCLCLLVSFSRALSCSRRLKFSLEADFRIPVWFIS